jgi:hypothetical protein
MAGAIVPFNRDIFHRALLRYEFGRGFDNLGIHGANNCWNGGNCLGIIAIVRLFPQLRAWDYLKQEG